MAPRSHEARVHGVHATARSVNKRILSERNVVHLPGHPIRTASLWHPRRPRVVVAPPPSLAQRLTRTSPRLTRQAAGPGPGAPRPVGRATGQVHGDLVGS